MKLTSISVFVLAIVAISWDICSLSRHERIDGPGIEPHSLIIHDQVFGDTISESGAVQASTLLAAMGGNDSLNIKLSGKILEVCQKKGCWMELEMGGENSLHVSFKDYAFFVPKDAGGKTAIIDGYAKLDTVSVEELRHFAKDAGKSQEEIDLISAPEVEVSFEANGVIIKGEGHE